MWVVYAITGYIVVCVIVGFIDWSFGRVNDRNDRRQAEAEAETERRYHALMAENKLEER
jgi:hypothetical protein